MFMNIMLLLVWFFLYLTKITRGFVLIVYNYITLSRKTIESTHWKLTLLVVVGLDLKSRSLLAIDSSDALSQHASVGLSSLESSIYLIFAGNEQPRFFYGYVYASISLVLSKHLKEMMLHKVEVIAALLLLMHIALHMQQLFLIYFQQ